MLNLKNNNTWKIVTGWLVGVACVGTYFLGFGLTCAFYKAHLSLESIAERNHIASGVFWPLFLPGGLVTWYPITSFVVFVSVLGCMTLVLLRIRRRQLQVVKTETILKDDETLITRLP